ncbi:MAG: substrate-binding domain-containing protein, partial [Victivallaceae bacterium]
RWEGFRRTMHDAGIPREQYEIFILEEWVGENAANVIRAALDWQPEALIIGGGSFADQVFLELENRHLSVPGDISIAIFDRVSHPLHGYSDVCCVSQPFEELGRAAVELLNAEMNGRMPESILIQTEFHPGTSVRNA